MKKILTKLILATLLVTTLSIKSGNDYNTCEPVSPLAYSAAGFGAGFFSGFFATLVKNNMLSHVLGISTNLVTNAWITSQVNLFCEKSELKKLDRIILSKYPKLFNLYVTDGQLYANVVGYVAGVCLSYSLIQSANYIKNIFSKEKKEEAHSRP